MTIVSHGVAGIYWVGSLAEARGRGLGRAVTAAATNAGFDLGADVASLQASPMGEPVYRAMGFETIYDYRLLMSPPPEAARHVACGSSHVHPHRPRPGSSLQAVDDRRESETTSSSSEAGVVGRLWDRTARPRQLPSSSAAGEAARGLDLGSRRSLELPRSSRRAPRRRPRDPAALPRVLGQSTSAAASDAEGRLGGRPLVGSAEYGRPQPLLVAIRRLRA